ncbi:periplasmic heavy metal sensor [Brevundimonas lenta]|uniref:Putative membrane protein n=1 Tax=Brevundimonas lenta TaxID=424796 RepID=A0A7W6JBT5_9CAUL|nr:periplasmic heavy metal sensor [Brevundimonas lenta]MBB4082136.1 putative membrane protein [Brevundimonas lenta]
MSPKALKIALAASVALNLFAVAAGATLVVGKSRVEHRIESERRSPRDRSPMMVVSRLDPEVRERVRTALKASALAVKPDFEEARQKRRQAVALAGSPEFDPALARALLDQSRAAELRGRARLEGDAVALLATLDADDRAAFSEILTRRGRVDLRDRGRDPGGPPPPPR